MSINRANEKLWRAVDALATGVGTIQQRLAKAGDHCCVLKPDEDLPEDMREAYSELRANLTKIPGPDGSLKATILSMGDEDATVYASGIVRMYGEIRYQDGIESGKRMAGDEETRGEN